MSFKSWVAFAVGGFRESRERYIVRAVVFVVCVAHRPLGSLFIRTSILNCHISSSFYKLGLAQERHFQRHRTS